MSYYQVYDSQRDVSLACFRKSRMGFCKVGALTPPYRKNLQHVVTLGLAGSCFLGSLKQLHARAFTYQGCPHYANNFTYYAFWHCHNLPPSMLNNNPFHVIYVISDLCHTKYCTVVKAYLLYEQSSKKKTFKTILGKMPKPKLTICLYTYYIYIYIYCLFS